MNRSGQQVPSPAGRRASIAEVAAEAGVSVATVSRVLNGKSAKYSRETEARVRAAISKLSYRPAGAGRALRRGESHLVAVLAANLANPTMAAVAASTEVALRASGYAMVLCDTHDDPEIQDEYLLEMQAQFALALVLLAAVDSPQLRAFTAARAPLIFVNRRNPANPDSPVVGIDNAGASAEVAAVLHDEGARRVGLIHGPLFSSATRERVVGFCSAWRRIEPEGKVHIETVESADHLVIGYEAMGELLTAHAVETVFCLSDLIAFGAHRRAREMQRDVRFFGFDDTPLNDWLAPWLSSVHVPYGDFGEAIVERLTETSDPPRDILLPHSLSLRCPPDWGTRARAR
jgi:LacI family transcriptional regulator